MKNRVELREGKKTDKSRWRERKTYDPRSKHYRQKNEVATVHSNELKE